MEQSAMIELTVAEILDRWAQTIPVFLGRRMACVGCAVAPFETPVDVARIYGVDLTLFLHELYQVGPSPEATFGGSSMFSRVNQSGREISGTPKVRCTEGA